MQGDEGQGTLEIVAPSKWSVEAAGWTATYEKITKRLVDEECPEIPKECLRFHVFAAACVPPKKWMEAEYNIQQGGYQIYLSDSSKTRKEILVRIFKPLLGDVFSFKVVNQLFDALGIGKDYNYLLKVRFELYLAGNFNAFHSHPLLKVLWRVVYVSVRQKFYHQVNIRHEFSIKSMAQGASCTSNQRCS